MVIADRLLDRTADGAPFVDTRHVNLAGPVAMAVSMVVSIVLFSNQQPYTGAKSAPNRWPRRRLWRGRGSAPYANLRGVRRVRCLAGSMPAQAPVNR